MTTPRNFCHDEAARVIGDSAATAASGRPLSVLPRRSQPRGCAVRALAKVAAASAVTTTVWRGVLALRGGGAMRLHFLSRRVCRLQVTMCGGVKAMSMYHKAKWRQVVSRSFMTTAASMPLTVSRLNATFPVRMSQAGAILPRMPWRRDR